MLEINPLDFNNYFYIFLVNINNEFCKKLIKDYSQDFIWKRILDILNTLIIIG